MMQRAPWSRDLSLTRPLLALLALWVVLFAPQIFAAKAYVATDAIEFDAFSKYSQERWAEHHERTHWNPYVFTGMPTTVSLADTRPQWLPGPLLDAYDGLQGFALWPPLMLELLAHLLGMLAIALLARRLWGAGDVGMVWAGVAWGLAPGLLVPFAYGHDAQLVTASLIPVVLLLIHVVFAEDGWPTIAGAAIALALVVGFQGIGGHPQVLAYAALLAVAFAVQRAWHLKRWERLVWAGGAALFGAAIAAAVWWPALLYGQHSVRGEFTVAEAAPYSLAIRDLFAMVWPWAMGFGGPAYWGAMNDTLYPQYLGAPVVLFGLLGLVGAKERGAAWLLMAASLVAIVIALGVHTDGLHGLLQRVIPFGASFRVVVVALVVAQLGFALLSARGIERVLATLDTRGWRGPATFGWGAVIVFALAALLLGAGPLGDFYTYAMRAVRPDLPPNVAQTLTLRAALDLGFRALLMAGLMAALLWSRRTAVRSVALVVALAILAFDIGSVSAPMLWRTTGSLRDREPVHRPVAARLASENPEYRVMILVQQVFFSNQWVPWRARSISGYHGAVNQAWNDLRTHGLLAKENVLRAFSVQYVTGQYPPLDDNTRFSLAPESEPRDPAWRAVFTLPRAYAVQRVLAAASDDSVLLAMGSPYFQPDQFVLTTDRAAEGSYSSPASCQVRWIEDGPDHQVLEADTEGETFLVITDALFPGWTAMIDGKPAPIYRVNHLVRGLKLPAGHLRIELSYEPEGWAAATTVTRGAFALWFVIAALWGFRMFVTRRRAPA